MADFNDEIQATPITSFTSDIKAIAEKGELEYPKYRTLSQEQTTSYLKAKNLPEYQRKQALVELNKAKGQSGLKNARNQAVLQASDYLSGRNTEMWLGNSLASEDYAELVATVGAGVVGGTVGAEIGKGAVAKATTSKILQSAGAAAGAGIGASVLGGMVSAFTPTELGKDELPAELRDTTGFEAITKETSAEILRQKGYSEEQIEKLQKGEYLQTIGQKLILDSMSDMEYKANVLPKVEEGSIAAELTSGVMSFGEYALTGIAGRVLGKASAKAVQKDKFAGDRFGKLQARKEEQYGRNLDDVIERYGDIIGGKVGGAVVTAEMSSDIMGEGATKSVVKYIEETGDDKLLFYKADNKDIALDIASTHIQNVIENKLGIGSIIKNPRLAKKYGEWLSGFAQEFTQGEVSDVSEWLKGTQGWEDVVNGVGKNIVSGGIGAVLQGATGTAVYSYYHRKNVNALTDMIMKQSTPEAPLNEKQVRQFADQKLKDIESEVQVDMVKEIGDFLGASDDVGAIKNKIRDNVIEAINHQKDIMKDTIDGSAFDDMTEDEMAQYVEGVASDQTDNAVLYSLEEGTAISDSPMMKGETIDGTYYLEGKSYAGDNKKAQAQRRQVLKNAVYDNNNDDKSVKDIVKTTQEQQAVHLYNIKEVSVTQANGFNGTNTSYDSIITDKSGVVKQGNKNIVDNIEKQGARGGVYDPKTRSITLGGKADASTLPHEFAHYWIDKNFKWARSGKASQQWLEKWRAVEKFLGIDPDDKFLPKGGASEDFARAYERFVAEEEVPLVLKGAMMDFRDFVNDHYDEDLDDVKDLYDHFGRPIHINDEVKEWFKKSRYEDYLSPEERQVIKNRIIKDKEETESIKESVKEQESMEEIADKLPVESDLIENSVVIPTETKTTPQVAEKRKIGGGEEKESKGVIGQELGKTYESTSWDIQEELVDDYLSKVNVDTALEDLENGTYPQSIDANFLRSALVELLTEQGRENEALDLIEQTAESFTESAQVLQAARKLNTPFTNAIKMFEGAKAVQVANFLYGKKKDSLAKLDEKINTIIKRYEKDYLACKTDEDVQRVLDLIKKEAVNTFGIKGEELQFQTKEEKVFKKSQLRRGNIKAYRSRAKQTLRRALGISPTKAQVKAIKKHAVEVSKAVKEYRKAVKENKASAIDPTPVLEAQNRLNNYMVSQVPQGSFADMANSFMMANVLSNPATNTFNIYSTWVQMIPHILALKLNYGVGSIGWKEKAKIIIQALKLQGKTGYNIFSLRDFFDKKTIWAEKYYEPTSKLGKFQRFPLTTLGLADTVNKGITFLTAVDSIATNKAKKEGLKGDALKERAKELFYQALNTDPKTITKDGFEIRKQAVEEGEESTFTQNTQTAQAINKLRKTLNLGKKFGLGTVVMPFTTTIANIAEDTFKNYMFGITKGLVNAPRALALEFDKRATEEMKKEAWKSVTPKTKDVIKNLIGAMLLLAGLVPDDDDFVLGYDRQTEKDKDIRQNRNAPYSYAVRIGNKWVDLDTFGLGSQPMKMMLILRRNNFSSEGYMQAFASLIDMVPGIGELDDMYNKFSSTKNLAGMEKATTEAISDKFEELSVRMIPFSALFGQIASIEDDKKRETWNHWYDGMRAKIPYLRDTLPERTSSKTGQTIPQTDNLFNLATGSKIKDYKPASESDRARYQAYELGSKLQYKEKRSFAKYGETLQKSMTKQAKDTFNRKLPILMNSAKFKNMTDEEKKKAISKLHSQVVKDLKKNK